METETVALLPVLRRLEVLVGGAGAAHSLTGLRLLLEHLSHQQPQPSVLQSEDTESSGPAPLCEKIGKRSVLTLK